LFPPHNVGDEKHESWTLPQLRLIKDVRKLSKLFNYVKVIDDKICRDKRVEELMKGKIKPNLYNRRHIFSKTLASSGRLNNSIYHFQFSWCNQ